MKTFIALSASLAVNLAILGALDWSVLQSQSAPAGEVSVIQLEAAVVPAAERTDLVAYTGGAGQALL